MPLPPRAVLVTRRTDYDELLLRHGTRAQASFFLASREQSLEAIEDRHHRFAQALKGVQNGIPVEWRRTRVDRHDLDRFLFEPQDVVIVLGRDGLVANVAKYLRGQVVVGLDPDPERNAGILVPHPPEAAADLIPLAATEQPTVEERSMVVAESDDGQSLLALNELYVGHRTHQSARYLIRYDEAEERHSSSGLIVTTGTGSTGWARSIRRNRVCDVDLPAPTDPELAFFVREAWPSAATGVDLSDGVIREGQTLELTSRMNDDGVVFGDGVETDALEFLWGRRLTIRLADTRLHLLKG
jgi:NAD kinase